MSPVCSLSYLSRPRVSRRRRASDAHRPGFTLIETSLALIIIAVGVLALVEAQQAFIKSNDWSSHAATANYLANEVRELMRRLPKHDPVTGLYIETGAGGDVLRGWGPDGGELGIEDFDDIDDFDGLLISFTGTAGLGDGDLPGPVDAFGAVIPQIENDGTLATDGAGVPLPLRGWSQRVTVSKIDIENPSIVYDDSHVILPNAGGSGGVAVDRFPLRVTVDVFFRGVFDTEDTLVTSVTWIVP